MKKIIIGISEGLNYSKYEDWIKNEPEAEVIMLSYRLDNLNEIEKCDGVILSGGCDINPVLYHQP